MIVGVFFFTININSLLRTARQNTPPPRKTNPKTLQRLSRCSPSRLWFVHIVIWSFLIACKSVHCSFSRRRGGWLTVRSCNRPLLQPSMSKQAVWGSVIVASWSGVGGGGVFVTPPSGGVSGNGGGGTGCPTVGSCPPPPQPPLSASVPTVTVPSTRTSRRSPQRPPMVALHAMTSRRGSTTVTSSSTFKFMSIPCESTKVFRHNRNAGRLRSFKSPSYWLCTINYQRAWPGNRAVEVP